VRQAANSVEAAAAARAVSASSVRLALKFHEGPDWPPAHRELLAGSEAPPLQALWSVRKEFQEFPSSLLSVLPARPAAPV
jgi:hypothetical protein